MIFALVGACFALSVWCMVLTVMLFMQKPQKLQTGQTESGPVTIKNFIQDRFGNIIRKDKREARRGDDRAAWEAEQKAMEKH